MKTRGKWGFDTENYQLDKFHRNPLESGMKHSLLVVGRGPRGLGWGRKKIERHSRSENPEIPHSSVIAAGAQELRLVRLGLREFSRNKV